MRHWCRVWTDNARSSCDMPWNSGILGDFFHQHTFNIAWTSCCKKGLFSLDPAQLNIRSKKGSCFYAYEAKTKQQRRAKSNESCSNQMVGCFFDKTGHVRSGIIPATLWVKGYTRFVRKYVTGKRKRFRPHKVYKFLFRITSWVDLAMSVCPYERWDLENYKSWTTGIRHAEDSWAS